MEELWQLYDEQGRVLVGQGTTWSDAYSKGLLHGASHVWIWRKKDNVVEVLLQKRAKDKNTWPNLFDISAAGHIDLGEEPLTASIRETIEEIGLTVDEKELKLAGVERRNLISPNGRIENEFNWVYTLELDQEVDFILQENEVTSLFWKKLSDFKDETLIRGISMYVPHGSQYFGLVISAIELASTS